MEREQAEQARREFEQREAVRIANEKLAMQQQLAHNIQLAAANKKPPTSQASKFDMLLTDDETDDESKVHSGRPPVAEWSTRKWWTTDAMVKKNRSMFRLISQVSIVMNESTVNHIWPPLRLTDCLRKCQWLRIYKKCSRPFARKIWSGTRAPSGIRHHVTPQWICQSIERALFVGSGGSMLRIMLFN